MTENEKSMLGIYATSVEEARQRYQRALLRMEEYVGNIHIDNLQDALEAIGSGMNDAHKIVIDRWLAQDKAAQPFDTQKWSRTDVRAAFGRRVVNGDVTEQLVDDFIEKHGDYFHERCVELGNEVLKDMAGDYVVALGITTKEEE